MYMRIEWDCVVADKYGAYKVCMCTEVIAPRCRGARSLRCQGSGSRKIHSNADPSPVQARIGADFYPMCNAISRIPPVRVVTIPMNT